MNDILLQVQEILGPLWPVLIFILILLVGYIVAKILERLARSAFRRTSIDERIAAHIPGDNTTLSTEYIAGRLVFWVVIIIALTVAFEAVDIGAVNGSLGAFTQRILGYLPNLIGAALLALVAYLVATVLRFIATKAMRAADLDRRIMSSDPDAVDPTVQTATAPASVSKALGDAIFYFILLLFLPAVLDALGLGGILAPVQGLLNEVLTYLPNLLLAAVILLVGWFVAKIIRNIVTNLLAAAGADRLSDRVGLSRATGSTRMSSLIGLIVYILVLVPVIVAALNALQVDAVTAPASAMLGQFLEAIPNIFVAALILGIAYVVGRLVASLIASLLTGIGFNRLFSGLGFTVTSADPEPEVSTPVPALNMRTPAGLVGAVVMVGVMLFASIEAADALGFEALALLLAEFTILAGRVLLGLVIFGVGLYLANLAYAAIQGSRQDQSAWLAVAARVSILVLAAAMGLREMGLADSIINLAFGLTLGAIAVAAALAFGLGGRDLARETLRKMSDRLENEEPMP